MNYIWKTLEKILMLFCRFLLTMSEILFHSVKEKFIYKQTTVNKSKYLIAFGKLLIDKFLFNEVEINFMIPGHTKFSPDRSFGTFKNELRKNEVLNI